MGAITQQRTKTGKKLNDPVGAVLGKLTRKPKTPRLEVQPYFSRYVFHDFEYHNAIGDDLYVFHKDICVFPTKALEQLVQQALRAPDKKAGFTVMAQRTTQDEAFSHMSDYDKNYNRGQGPIVSDTDIAIQLDLSKRKPRFSLNYLPLED